MWYNWHFPWQQAADTYIRLSAADIAKYLYLYFALDVHDLLLD
jgi:hypothetical protein